SDLRLNGLRQQRTGAATPNLSERIGEGPWFRELEDVSVGHGVSLLQRRSGGVEHPHDTPPYPFMPSPTSAHNSAGSGGSETLLLPLRRNAINFHLQRSAQTAAARPFCGDGAPRH